MGLYHSLRNTIGLNTGVSILWPFAEELEDQPDDRRVLHLYFGFLSGYLVATTGHQKGVIVNITLEEVTTVQKTQNNAHIIRASMGMLNVHL